ncbi:hypothetical protein GCM10010428_71780 [Actinosynnema pretiosum subsp. pretiosum]
MRGSADLPEPRPMPEALADGIWAAVEPGLDLDLDRPGERSRRWRAPLAVAASVAALTLGVVQGLPGAEAPPEVRVARYEVAAGPRSGLVGECLEAAGALPEGFWREGRPAEGPWRAGVQVENEAGDTFLVIRSDVRAGVCLIQHGRAAAVLGGDFLGQRTYPGLTAERPFGSLTSMNKREDENIHFGFTSDEVTGVSLIGAGGGSSPATVVDGTFAVKNQFPEDRAPHSTNTVVATLSGGAGGGGAAAGVVSRGRSAGELVSRGWGERSSWGFARWWRWWGVRRPRPRRRRRARRLPPPPPRDRPVSSACSRTGGRGRRACRRRRTRCWTPPASTAPARNRTTAGCWRGRSGRR